ncbi:pyruvate carboxylase [Antarcticibacterium flavum]|uniref:Pyruvate carboxylase n=1 Tax=Antarcticibacterium flavum TaxID=2058175 RepID=A0A5B7X5D8_9FLAO|nr:MULTISPECIES: pyruvate carboxylase [Antarcticibacterium]MCM4159989.1 pyruvate carboxylase [Antarcticibacterium sp. W02-3]QCY70420.1 pyruvate carboxylase [Antarcticibacterium flavum]
MKIKKVLVANRGEIAIRIFRACTEIGIKTVGIYTFEDRYSLHRYKADESYQVGEDKDPLKPYLNINAIIQVALKNEVDAIHPGYGFLSENAEFAKQCEENGIIFIGPKVEVLKSLGDKVRAKEVAVQNEVPIIQSNDRELDSLDIALEEAQKIGYPVMLKAASGGGGRGMRVIRDEDQLRSAFPESKREAGNAFGDDTVFIEKFVENPKHIEIQIVADNHGNMVHLFERDCSVQRRYQKVIEFAPSLGLDQNTKEKLYDYALRICKAVNYNNIGTVEFLVENGEIYFIEVNPRIQVEHTVTEIITNIDLVKTQLFIAGGYKLSDKQIKIEDQDSLETNGYALQCRITTEDPTNDFKPDYGTITTYRSASGFGIRLDGGSVYQGVKISPFFDSMLVKVSASSRTLDGACRKMRRALAEFRVRGVMTNMAFLDNILQHPTFREGKVTVNFIKDNPELFKIRETRNRATKMVKFLGDITVNGNPDVREIDPHKKFLTPKVPKFDEYAGYPKGTKDLLTEQGPEKFSRWLRHQGKVQFTDTTFRDAHQSLLATRMRTYDMMKVAEGFAKNHPQIFSMEVWGGATFDVALRFLKENPWERLQLLRKAMPNVLLQMLLRGSNGVGYTAYPDNLIERFVNEAWENGVDVFRIFDSLNWMQSIEPCIKYVRNNTNGLAEAAMCYTGDILKPKSSKYTLEYYVELGKQMEDAGAHILGIKDMAGILKPYAAEELIGTLKSRISIPIHLHTHDTSSIQAATYLKAIEAGVDVVDVALGGLSGLTSQPNFNSIVEMLGTEDRTPDIDIEKLNEYSHYWEAVRSYYYPFESGLKAGSADVYKNEIPGGQYSNLKPQAESLGLADRFYEITQMYEKVNDLFGDIIKVTPSSKVVGDMAQYLVSNNLSIEDVLEKGESLSFPQSVKSFFKGDLGQPVGGFPEKIQKIILKDEEPYTERPNAHLEPIDFETEFEEFRQNFKEGMGRSLDITDFLSYKLYPKVFTDAYNHHKEFGNIITIPTKNFFYGMKPGEEIIVEMDKGKTLLIELMSIGEANEDGLVDVFFKVNGQTRAVKIKDRSVKVEKVSHVKADKSNPKEVGAPLQGSLASVLVKAGQEVKKNEPLFIIEAMKMETTITSNTAGEIEKVVLPAGEMVFADDLVVVMK